MLTVDKMMGATVTVKVIRKLCFLGNG